MNPKRPSLRHIIIKMSKVKDKKENAISSKEKIVTYKGAPIKMSADISTEILQVRKEWQEVLNVMKSKDLQPRLLYPAKLSFRMAGHIKDFPDKKR